MAFRTENDASGTCVAADDQAPTDAERMSPADGAAHRQITASQRRDGPHP